MPEPFTNPLRLALMALAVFRVAHMLWWEFGPADVFWKLRERMGVLVMNGGEEPFLYGNTFLGKLFACPLCLSVWGAGALVALYLAGMPWLTTVLDVLCVWLALAAVSLLLFGWKRE